MRFSRIILTTLATLATIASTLHAQTLPSSSRWMTHLSDELMPFWTTPGAMGSPIGAFPSTRCDDGTVVDTRRPCTEVARNSWLMQLQRYLVAQSRQTYGYGVAFHMTGDRRYLDLMRAGVDYMRTNAVDRARGGMYTLEDPRTGSWGPRAELRNPQELAYGLLGLTFYYYLTRDEEVLNDITFVKDYIFREYYNPSLNALQWQLENSTNQPKEDKKLVAQLDQMNAYLVLITPLLPEPRRTEWTADLVRLSRLMMDQFYSQQENVFFLSANKSADLDLTVSATDFGHTIKALWMIRFTGLLAGDKELVTFAESNGRRVLERAFLPDSGSWASGLKAGGALDPDKSWWIYAELDQFAATMSLTDPTFNTFLERTYPYYLETFVDKKFGEVWTTINGETHQPRTDMPKAWPWKNAYHSVEHSLVAYIATSKLEGLPVRLYYAFPNPPADTTLIRPYFYSGQVRSISQHEESAWAVEFDAIQ